MFDIVKEDLAALETAMFSAVACETGVVTEIGAHLIAAGGKRLRPALYFLAVRCGKARSESGILPLALALEMVHMATLMHDDVIDRADLRRGIPTANAKWGNQIAVLSGDYFFAKAFSLVARNYNDPQVIAILSDVICDLSEGELAQNQSAFAMPEGEADYYGRIAKKTANFIAASCQLGAIVAGLGERSVQALRRYGYAIGMAFQITDDILDIVATEKQIGKPVGNDMLEGIVTLPVIRALAVSDHAAELRELIAGRSLDRKALARALHLVHATDAVEYSYHKVGCYLQEAKNALPPALPADVRAAFEAVAGFVAARSA